MRSRLQEELLHLWHGTIANVTICCAECRQIDTVRTAIIRADPVSVITLKAHVTFILIASLSHMSQLQHVSQHFKQINK